MREIIRSKPQQVCRSARLRLVLCDRRRQVLSIRPTPAAQKVTEIGERRGRLTGSGGSSDGIAAVPDVEEIRIVVAPEPGKELFHPARRDRLSGLLDALVVAVLVLVVLNNCFMQKNS